jgi:hypothetical protein
MVSYTNNTLIITVPGFSTYIIISDITPPTISVTAPSDSSSTSAKNITLSATASDNVEVASVSFFVDGSQVGSTIASLPYSTSWNATVGAHTISAVAYDSAGNHTTSSIIHVTITAAVTPGGGGGGGGGASHPPTNSQGCPPGNSFNMSTGQACVNGTRTQILGCGNRNTGFSSVSGQSCTLNVVNPNQTSYNFGTVTLRSGSTGEAVKELQRFLNAKLNLGLVIDGKLGPKTIAVIKQWQKDNGLVADGLIGPKTKARMNGV